MFKVLKGIMKIITVIAAIVIVFSVYSIFSSSLGVISGQTSGQAAQTYQEQWQANENHMAIIKYGRKAMATAVGIAQPILAKMGIEITGTWTEDTDEITRQMENATQSLNNTTDQMKPR